MPSKRSKHELKRLVEQAVETVCAPREGLWFCAHEVEPCGNPPDRLKVWATLHFLPVGSPFCCGEPGCHLGLFGERLTQVADQIRRAMNLTQCLEVGFGDRLGVRYHDGVAFEVERQMRKAQQPPARDCSKAADGLTATRDV